MEHLQAALLAAVLPVASIVWAAGALYQRLTSHEQRDEDRFDELRELLKEQRDDIKSLLKGER